MAEVTLGSLYEINKQLIKKDGKMDPILFNKKISEITKIMMDDQYWTLMCRDNHDYTVFNIVNIDKDLQCEKSLKGLLDIRGDVYAIDNKGKEAWEIWIEDHEDHEMRCYMLFNYRYGMVEI